MTVARMRIDGHAGDECGGMPAFEQRLGHHPVCERIGMNAIGQQQHWRAWDRARRLSDGRHDGRIEIHKRRAVLVGESIGLLRQMLHDGVVSAGKKRGAGHIVIGRRAEQRDARAGRMLAN